MKNKLPSEIPIFPLSNFIIFPRTNVPLNIFEKRYLNMVDDCMKNNRIIGMVQPKNKGAKNLYDIGCMGKITSFSETNDGRYIIVLNGFSRFKIIEELNNNKLYRECKITCEEFKDDLIKNDEKIKSQDLNQISENLEKFFSRQGYSLNKNEFEKKSLEESINMLAMISPFTLEEKQMLLEAKSITLRKEKISEIIQTYLADNFRNTTIQ
tara:strand:- start:637 stop:1266 length:630 start_codon:yes stop_codon:yes gene_type:complete